MKTDPPISVIIPTFNRKDSLLCTLNSLVQQSWSQFEVILVDDGSTDETAEAVNQLSAVNLRYLYQANAGGVKARNRGAHEARGDILVFLDDDMTLGPDYISAMVKAHSHGEKLVTRGRLVPWTEKASVFAQVYGYQNLDNSGDIGCFTSNNLAIRRQSFHDLGGWREVILNQVEHRGGLWADVEFAYRAWYSGFQLLTVPEAEITHRDYAATDLHIAAGRARMISRAAVSVLREHPALAQHVPMLHDKGPIKWCQDSPALILRKLARQTASSRPAMTVMERAVPILEHHAPTFTALRLLYRWIISGYIYRGYREGLRTTI